MTGVRNSNIGGFMCGRKYAITRMSINDNYCHNAGNINNDDMVVVAA